MIADRAAAARRDAAVEVIEVIQPEPESHGLRGAEISLPATGDRSATWALELRGLAAGGDVPVAAVEVASRGEVLRTPAVDVERPAAAGRLGLPADAARIGFRTLVGMLAVPAEFELELCGVLADGGRVPLGAVRGRRAELRTGHEAAVQPLLVTTLGRTGSMLMMRLLEAHPQVLVHRPYRYEQRVAGYWIEVLLALADPAGSVRQLAPAGSLDDPHWWLGDEGRLPAHNVGDDAVREWLGRDAIVELARTCQERIDALYAQVAALQPEKRPAFFAEKHTLRSAALTHELYPAAGELFLVRDFRDMVASILAFNRKRGVRGFGEAAAADERDYVARLGRWADQLVAAHAERAGRAHVVRYEDLVQATEPTLTALLGHLGLDAGGETIAGMVRALEEDHPALAEHATTDDPRASIGRWRTDLDSELQEACAASFGAALRAFGYK